MRTLLMVFAITLIFFLGVMSSLWWFGGQLIRIEQEKLAQLSKAANATSNGDVLGEVLQATDGQDPEEAVLPKGKLIVNVPSEFNSDVIIRGQALIYDLIGGTGIQIVNGDDGVPTVVNADPGSGQEIFKRVRVGNDILSAGSNDDVLVLEGGGDLDLSVQDGRILISGAGTTEITEITEITELTETTQVTQVNNITNTTVIENKSGFLDNGSTITLETETDKLAVGTDIAEGKLHVLGAGNEVGLVVEANVGQTANLSEWKNVDGDTVIAFDKDGNANFEGTITHKALNLSGNTIEFTGDATNLVFDVQSPEPTNLLLNPGLEADLSNWSYQIQTANLAVNGTFGSNLNSWDKAPAGATATHDGAVGRIGAGAAYLVSEPGQAMTFTQDKTGLDDTQSYIITAYATKIAERFSNSRFESNVSGWNTRQAAVDLTETQDDHVLIDNTGALRIPTTQTTLEGWFYYDKSYGSFQNRTLFATERSDYAGNGFVRTHGLRAFDRPDEIIFSLVIDGVLHEIDGDGFNSFAWNHVAGSWDGTTMRLFINGSQRASKTVSGNLEYNSGFIRDWAIGSLHDGDDPYEGYADEVRMWDIGLTQQQIQARMNTELDATDPLWSNLVGYWKMNEASGQIVADSSGQSTGVDGTLGDGTGIETDDPAWTTAVTPDVTGVFHSNAPTYDSSAGSARVVPGSQLNQSVNLGSTDPYVLTAFAYNSTPGEEGSGINNTIAQLHVGGTPVTTTYELITGSGGWYKLTADITGSATNVNFGVVTAANKIVHLDNMSLRQVGIPVTAGDMQLWYGGQSVSPTITNAGSDWYRFQATVSGANPTGTFGVEVQPNTALYIDDVSLQLEDTASRVSHQTENTYDDSEGAGRLDARSTAGITFTQNISLVDTNDFNFTANVYNHTLSDLGVVDDTVAVLTLNGSEIAGTTYTDNGDGWFRLNTNVAQVPGGTNEFGVLIKQDKFTDVDAFNLVPGRGKTKVLKIENSGSGLTQLDVESTTTLRSGTYGERALIIRGASGQSENLTEWRDVNDNILTVFDEQGWLGIGTSNPDKALVAINEANTGQVAAIVNTNTTDGSTAGVLRLGTGVDTSGTAARFIQFYAGATDDTDGTGVGRIRLNGTGVAYESGGADFAEYFASARPGEQYEPGDVVALGSTGQADTTVKAYHPGTLGVVSDTAAFVGNARPETEATGSAHVLVGIQGQIEVKVATAGGVIRAGDPLTTSPIEGHAMRATEPGMVLGTALEDYTASESGTIRAYISRTWNSPLAQVLGMNTGPGSASEAATLGQTVSLLQDPFARDISSGPAQLTEGLTVAGNTNLYDTTITGNLSVGLLTIDGLAPNPNADPSNAETGASSAAIDTITGALLLQSQAAGTIELMGGRTMIDRIGSVILKEGSIDLKQGDITVQKGTIVGNNTFSDTVTLPAHTREVRVERTWETAPKTILITAEDAFVESTVSDISSTGFTIRIKDPRNEPTAFFWLSVF